MIIRSVLASEAASALHSAHQLIHVVAGRRSSEQVNLWGMPCEPKCRLCLEIEPGKSWKIVDSDSHRSVGMHELASLSDKVYYAPVYAHAHSVYPRDGDRIG